MDAFRDVMAMARTAAVVFAVTALAGPAGTRPAHAALFWSDSDPAVQPPRAPSQLRKRKPRRAGDRPDIQARDNAKPQGPLVIAVSIEKQRVKVYDASGLFAESPVSTGMRGHSTPMGVFSVIQKHKWHRSNIYSGAPMPYMQRVTWSGVAMHAGVLPGYPASHGCIRMPMAFAVKMWGWTRMGARVIITPGEVAPSEFTHPLLTAQKPATPAVPVAAVPVAAAPVAAVPVASISPASAPTAERTQTADAGGALPDMTKSDAAPAATTEVDETPPQAPASSVAEPATKGLTTKDQTTKDQARASDPEKVADPQKVADPAKPAVTGADPTIVPAPKRSGQIAAFVSRKDNRLYVRQNFTPLFDVPVTIAPSDRPLGTHVFTARADKDDAKLFRWSVVSLPAAVRREMGDAASRRRKSTGAIEMTSAVVPDSPAEALDRLAIPDDAMARVMDALATGGSLVVSDQGIAGGETGEGTDFIVSLR